MPYEQIVNVTQMLIFSGFWEIGDILCVGLWGKLHTPRAMHIWASDQWFRYSHFGWVCQAPGRPRVVKNNRPLDQNFLVSAVASVIFPIFARRCKLFLSLQICWYWEEDIPLSVHSKCVCYQVHDVGVAKSSLLKEMDFIFPSHLLGGCMTWIFLMKLYIWLILSNEEMIRLIN